MASDWMPTLYKKVFKKKQIYIPLESNIFPPNEALEIYY